MVDKVAEIRNQKDGCPFGLKIPLACRCAGEIIDEMIPLSILDGVGSGKEKKQIAAANSKLISRTEPCRCKYAGKIINKKNMVECNYGSTAPGVSEQAMLASPFYSRIYNNVGTMDGLYNVPIGYVADNNTSRNSYYGIYSLQGSDQSVNLQTNANNIEYNKITEEKMSLAKLAQNVEDEDDVSFAEDEDDESSEEIYIEDEIDALENLQEELKEEDEVEFPDDIEVDEDDEDYPDDEVEEGEAEIEGSIQVDDEPIVFRFVLPLIPGSDLVEEDIISNDEHDDKDEVIIDDNDPKNKFDWKKTHGTKNFLSWVQKMFNEIPRHNGEILGIERAIGYLNALDKSISNALRADIHGEIDVKQIDEAKTAVENGIQRLTKELERLVAIKEKAWGKKKANDEQELIKEAQKITGVGKVVITVPLFLSRIARVCINSMVSAGKDIEDVFAEQSKLFDLTEREQLETIQLMEDMGYTVHRDRGVPLNENIDVSSEKNFDWAPNYQA